jgi:hypothetical protein
MVEVADNWKWSSAAAHCGIATPDPMLEMERWRKRWGANQWQEFLAEKEATSAITALRHSTHTGRPLGSPEFVAALENRLLRPLAARKGGRPKKTQSDPRQLCLTSVA